MTTKLKSATVFRRRTKVSLYFVIDFFSLSDLCVSAQNFFFCHHMPLPFPVPFSPFFQKMFVYILHTFCGKDNKIISIENILMYDFYTFFNFETDFA